MLPAGDLSDRVGYDFDQLFAIAKVQVGLFSPRPRWIPIDIQLSLRRSFTLRVLNFRAR
jgi:hypothetical protein